MTVTRHHCPLPLNTSQLRPGLRLAIGLSGGADSVALTRVLAERAAELGVVLQLAHVHHGLRDAEADRDCDFCVALAKTLGLAIRVERVETRAEAVAAGEGVEEAARRLRYGFFRRLMREGVVDAVATAHTLDDQAETVLGKLLRGGWTQGLAGIYPVVRHEEGCVVRPMLGVRRAEVEAWLKELGQDWCEDSSNREMVFTRNRIRHEVLPMLESSHPQVQRQLANVAEIAREEEAYWRAEMERLEPIYCLQGKPVRGGGRAAGDGVAFDAARLGELSVAARRRLVRFAVEKMGVVLDFEATGRVLELAEVGRRAGKVELPGALVAERTPRELRIAPGRATVRQLQAEVEGTGVFEAFGFRFTVHGPEGARVVVRPWKAGDRVTVRYASGPRKVKEVLERMKVSGADRVGWPVAVHDGQLVWMRGVAVEPGAGLRVSVEELANSAPESALDSAQTSVG